MLYLLDANVISDIMRNPQGPAANRLRVVGHLSVCTSAIISAEMLFGARKRGSPALTRRIENTLAKIAILPFEPHAEVFYAEIRFQLERKGTPISGNDLLIASQALALNLTVVTDNVREFGRVDGWSADRELAPGGSDRLDHRLDSCNYQHPLNHLIKRHTRVDLIRGAPPDQ